jgi:hypothetical protein
MAKTASINVVASDFTRAMREMSKLTGATFADIIRSETQSILEAATKKTQAAQVKLIKANIDSRPARTTGGKTYLMNWRMPDAVWAAIQKQMRDSLKRRKDARGLAKKSWVQAAEKLGLTLKVPNYVSKATAKGGDYPQNAQAEEKQNGAEFFIQITNERTYSRSVIDAIRAAIRGRTRFFQNNLRRGVFKKTADIAAKYPGIKAT